MRLVVVPVFVLVVVASSAGPALATHRSVGGDVATNFPPAREHGLPDGRDVAGNLEYANSADPDLHALDRVAPPDQSYREGVVGYFDVVAVEYAGTFDVTWPDPVANFVSGPPGHRMVTSANVYYSAPPLGVVNALAPGVVDGSGSGTVYPTILTFYAYLFGDGNANDADGAPLLAGSGAFEGLVDEAACDARGTRRCQMLSPGDVAALGSAGSGREAAVCGWAPGHHFHPGARVDGCRDFDFRFLAEGSGGEDGDDRGSSPTWLHGSVPGWYATVFIQMPTRATAWVEGSLPFHFTVAAAFDPEVIAQGARPDPETGASDLSCIEPGFDVAEYAAHDVDVYPRPSPFVEELLGTSRNVGASAATWIEDVANAAGPAGDELADAHANAREPSLEPDDNPAVFARRPERPLYATDTHGLIRHELEPRLRCIDPDTGSFSPVTGKVANVRPAWRNWLEAWIYQDARSEGVAPLRGVDLDDERGGQDGGVTFYFGDPEGRPALAEWSTFLDVVELQHALTDTGPECTPASDPSYECLGWEMFAKGYRTPTALTWVVQVKGPVILHDARRADGVRLVHADAETHCVLGTSRGIIDDDGVVGSRGAALQVLADHVAPGTSVPLNTADAAAEALRGALCPEATTMDLFPGDGFVPFVDGGSVNNLFGWTVPSGSLSEHAAVVDLYYLITVDQDPPGLAGDQLGLDEGGWPTEIETGYEGTTHLWRHRSVLGD